MKRALFLLILFILFYSSFGQKRKVPFSKRLINSTNSIYKKYNSKDTIITNIAVLLPNKKLVSKNLTCRLIKENKTQDIKIYVIKPDEEYQYSNLVTQGWKFDLVYANEYFIKRIIWIYKPTKELQLDTVNIKMSPGEYEGIQTDSLNEYMYRFTGAKKGSISIYERKTIDKKLQWYPNQDTLNQINNIVREKTFKLKTSDTTIYLLLQKIKLLSSYDLEYVDHDKYPRGRPVSLNKKAELVYENFNKNPILKKVVFDVLNKSPNEVLSLEEMTYIYEFNKKIEWPNYLNLIQKGYKTFYSINTFAFDSSIQINPSYTQRYFKDQTNHYVQLQEYLIEGYVDTIGNIIETNRTVRNPLTYPICLSSKTKILTPNGFIKLSNLKVGMGIISRDQNGVEKIAALVMIDSVKSPINHQIISITTKLGNHLEASPNHPLISGKKLIELAKFDSIENDIVENIELVPYLEHHTYDILLNNETSYYNANGIWLRSTLKK